MQSTFIQRSLSQNEISILYSIASSVKFPRDFEHYMVTWICFHVKVLYYPLIAVRKKDIAPQLFWVQLRDTQKT